MGVWLGATATVADLRAFAPQDAQEASSYGVTLSEALTGFATHGAELRIARSASARAAAEARAVRAYPNTRFSFYREALSYQGQTDWENTFGVTQPLEWPTSTRSRWAAAEHEIAALEADFRGDSIRLAAEAAIAWTEAWSERERERALRGLADRIGEMVAVAEARLEAGDVSGYAVRRFRVARAIAEQEARSQALRARDARRRLAVLVAPADREEVHAEGDPDWLPPEFDAPDALAALHDRPDLDAARARARAASGVGASLHAEWLPAPTLGFYHRRRADGFSGLAVELAFPVAIFGWARPDRAAGAAAMSAATFDVSLKTRRAGQEVSAALEAYETARAWLAETGEGLGEDAEVLMNAALGAYREGEMTAFEVLDAAEAHTDALLKVVEMRATAWKEYFNLLRTTGRGPGEGR